MRRMMVVVAAVALVGGGWARGEGLDVRQVPDAARWVIHVDCDAVQKSKVWGWIEEKLKDRGEYQQKVREIEQVTGMKWPVDLHEVTLYGATADGADAVVAIGAKVEQARLQQMLSMAEGFGSSVYGKHDLLTWVDKDKGKTMFGSFVSDTRMVLSQNKEEVQKALDLADGKGEGLKDADLPGGHRGVLLLVSGRGLSELMKAKDPKNPLIGQLRSAWIELSETEGEVMIRARLKAKDATAAERVRQSLEGIRAIVSLAAGAEQADEKTKLAAAALEKAKISSKADVVEVEWSVGLDRVKELFDKMPMGRGGVWIAF